LSQEETRPRILLIAAMIAPSVLLLLTLNANYVRFLLPLFPPLLILAGKASADLIGARPAYLRLIGAAAATVAIAVAALHSLVADLKMANDSRRLALEWVERNVPPGAAIEITSYVARPSDDRYQVLKRPFIVRPQLGEWIERIEESAVYRVMQPIYLAYKRSAENVGICAAAPYHYRGWYDLALSNQVSALQSFDFSIAGLEARAPDILIVSQSYYARYLDDRSSVEGNFYADLFAGRPGYRQVAEFRYRPLPWPDPMVDFINPTIRIFQRAPGQSVAPPAG
jgi:hypothetical protein